MLQRHASVNVYLLHVYVTISYVKGMRIIELYNTYIYPVYTHVATATSMITMMSPSELSQPVSQDIIQTASTDHVQIMETSIVKSVVSNTPILTPTLKRDDLESGMQKCIYIMQ